MGCLSTISSAPTPSFPRICLWQKSLERAKFKWPRKVLDGVISLTGQQLNWLLDGYDIMAMKAHKRLHYHSVL